MKDLFPTLNDAKTCTVELNKKRPDC